MKPLIETDQDFICDIQAPCFQMLSEEEAALIRASKTQVVFRKGETLTKQGTFASYVLFIMSGLVKQYVEGDSTHNYNLQLVQPNEFLGLSAVFGEAIYPYSATALMETQVYLIEKEAINKVVQQNGMFAYTIIKRYCELNTRFYSVVRNLIYKQMNGHMADALLYLSSGNFDGLEVTALLTRKEIADFAGISTESAVKILKSFEKEGILNLNEKSVIIRNRERLEEISKHG
jgi:CRP/FNR family transcriptional regulator